MGMTRRRPNLTNYTRRELQVLWHLKRYGPITKPAGHRSILNTMAQDLQMHVSALRYVLGSLENRSLVLRTYRRKKFEQFESQGYNPLLKIELVDPNMDLPPFDPIPLGVVMAQENRELQERIDNSTDEPSAEAIVEALLNRLVEYQQQIDKLQDIIVQQEQEMCRLKKMAQAPKVHISQRLGDFFTPEQWQELKGK